MMHSTQGLYDMLRSSLAQIEKQIEITTKDIQDRINAWPYPDLYEPMQIKDDNGNFILLPLIVAKSDILSAMAALKARELTERGRR